MRIRVAHAYRGKIHDSEAFILIGWKCGARFLRKLQRVSEWITEMVSKITRKLLHITLAEDERYFKFVFVLESSSQRRRWLSGWSWATRLSWYNGEFTSEFRVHTWRERRKKRPHISPLTSSYLTLSSFCSLVIIIKNSSSFKARSILREKYRFNA